MNNSGKFRFTIIISAVLGIIIGFIMCNFLSPYISRITNKKNDTNTVSYSSEGIKVEDGQEIVFDEDTAITKTSKEVTPEEISIGTILEDEWEYGTILHYPFEEPIEFLAYNGREMQKVTAWGVILPKSFKKQSDGSFYSDTYKYSIQYVLVNGITTTNDTDGSNTKKIIETLGFDGLKDNYYHQGGILVARTRMPNEYSYVTIEYSYHIFEKTENTIEIGDDVVAGDINTIDKFSIVKIVKFNPNDYTDAYGNFLSKEDLRSWGYAEGYDSKYFLGYHSDGSLNYSKEDFISDLEFYLTDNGNGYWENKRKQYIQELKERGDKYTGHFYGGIDDWKMNIIEIYYYGFNGFNSDIWYGNW